MNLHMTLRNLFPLIQNDIKDHTKFDKEEVEKRRMYIPSYLQQADSTT